MTTSCLRCGHKLSAPSSIDRKYSLRCWRLELADRRAAALELAITAWSPKQRKDAKALIRAGRLKPTKRRGLYEITSSDEVTVYRTTVLGCGDCPATGLCYHRAAAAIADAYLEFGETLKAAA